MNKAIKVGDIVGFVTVDHGIDISLPSGTHTTNQIDRLVESRVHYPNVGAKGLVVAGPGWNEGKNLKLWQVYVDEASWWFTEDFLMPVNTT